MTEERVESLRAENELLRHEVRVSREAANITAEAVVVQFEKTEQALTRLQEVGAQRKAVFDAAAQVAIIAADRDGIIRLFNTGAEILLGYSALEAVGKLAPTAFLQADELAERARTLEKEIGQAVEGVGVLFAFAEMQRTKVREWSLVRRDGSRVPVDLSISALRGPSNEMTGFLCVALDLTEHKRAEQEIRAAMEAAEAANRTKSTFLANMSHELRTPLNAIIGYSEMLMEEAEDDANQSMVGDLKKIRSAGRHLLGLINDVLDLSKIEAGKIELSPEDIDVSELVAEVTRMAQPLVDKNGNVLKVECAPVGILRADALRLRQILFNLLSNAAKFTEKGTLYLGASVDPGDEQDWICFRVRDSGIGMTPEQAARLFQPFVQADASTTRKFGGTGLGLAISKQFCELMGGSIGLESELGSGTTFTVRLPRGVGAPKAQPAAAPEQPLAGPLPPVIARPARPTGPRTSVLVIDDDPGTRDLLSRHLQSEGYQVRIASDRAQGLELARAERPDAITLGVAMPDCDGWTVLAQLKSDPVTAEIPVMMLTVQDHRNTGYALGAADFLVKPIDRSRLLRVLSRYQHSSGAGPRVLVVEDDTEVRGLMCRTLKKEGCEVREAENGQAALERLAEGLPDLILLDLMMPVMNGFELLDRLREKKEWAMIPQVVVTALDLTESEKRLLKSHVQQVLQRGTHQEQLLSDLRRLIVGAVETSAVKR